MKEKIIDILNKYKSGTECENIDAVYCDDFESVAEEIEKLYTGTKIFCTCGLEITEISWWNKENEEGENCCDVWCRCTCGKEYETETWGHCDDSEEAINVLSDPSKGLNISKNLTKYI